MAGRSEKRREERNDEGQKMDATVVAGDWIVQDVVGQDADLLDFAEVGRPHAMRTQCSVELFSIRHARQRQPLWHLEWHLRVCSVLDDTVLRLAPVGVRCTRVPSKRQLHFSERFALLFDLGVV